MTSATTLAFAALTFIGGKVLAQEPSRVPPPGTLTVEGGKGTEALVVEAELEARFGLIIGGGGGKSFVSGPTLEAYVGYRLPFFGTRWTLRPGARASRSWANSEGCMPRCALDTLAIELGLHYRGPSGFVMAFGLPALAWIHASEEPGDTEPKFQAGGQTVLYFGSILFGYAFDL